MTAPPRKPPTILLAALLLPGSGHVLMGVPNRGLMFLFFMIVIGWAGAHAMPETASFLVRHIGGIFVYGLSVIDAYKMARVNWEKWKYAQTHTGD